jgi:RND family efflux transporter MFP subunit
MGTKSKKILQFLIVLIFIGLGVLGMRTLMASKASLVKRKPPTPLPMVRVIEAETGPRHVIIVGQGTVNPLKEIQLVPQVGGKVVDTSPAMVNGGAFKKGETLLQIDPVDYKLAVAFYESKVKDSESKLQLLAEEAAVAKEEWYQIHQDRKQAGKPPPLLAKEPQLAASKARLEADRAELKKAVLQLERTELKAPFSGRVSEERVDIGQHVTPGQALATIYATGAAEILVPLENDDLFWFHVPGFTPGDGAGAAATVRAQMAGRNLTWKGRVVRAEGKMDERTRMINVVVRVEKPYARKPPLAVGLFVTVEIEGRTLPKAAVIPRSALREGERVWVVDSKSRLHFRRVNVARLTGEGVIVSEGINHGDRVVVSPLKVVTEGMKVRTALVGEVKGS